GHGIAQHVYVTVALRQTLCERFPFVAARFAAVDAQFPVKRKMFGVALDRHDVDSLWLMRVNVDRETEVGRQIAADLMPRLAGVIAAQDVPVLLHEQHIRTRGMHRDAMNAVADLASRIGNIKRMQAAIDRLPSLAAVIRAKRASRRNRDKDSFWVTWIENDGVQAHPAGARLPRRTGAVAAQSRKLLPRPTAVGRAEQGGVLNTGIDCVRIGQRRFEMPDSLELPRMCRAVVPLMRGERLARFGRCIVNKLVALALGRAIRSGGRFARRRSGLVPGLAAII